MVFNCLSESETLYNYSNSKGSNRLLGSLKTMRQNAPQTPKQHTYQTPKLPMKILYFSQLGSETVKRSFIKKDCLQEAPFSDPFLKQKQYHPNVYHPVYEL